MPIDISDKEQLDVPLTGTQMKEAIVQAHNSKSAMAKIKNLQSTDSEIDNLINKLNISAIDKPIMMGGLGDSITRNQLSPENKSFGDITRWTSRSWLPKVAMKMNRKAWANIYAVEGYSGERTDQIYNSMLDANSVLNTTHTTPQPNGVLANSPDVCIEFSGTNDNYFSYSLEHMITNRKLIWQRLIDNGIIPIALSLLPNSLTGDVRNTQIPTWNARIKEEASAMGIIFVDVYTPCVGDDGGFKYGLNFSLGVPDVVDGLHPGSDGCIIIADEISKVLNERLFTRRETATVKYGNENNTNRLAYNQADLESYKLFDSDGLFTDISTNWQKRYDNNYLLSTRTAIDDNSFSQYGNTLTVEYPYIDNSSDGYSDFFSPSIDVVAGEKYGIFFRMGFEPIDVNDRINVSVFYNEEFTPIYAFPLGGSDGTTYDGSGNKIVNGNFYQEIIIPDTCTSIRLFFEVRTKIGEKMGIRTLKLAQVGTVKIT